MRCLIAVLLGVSLGLIFPLYVGFVSASHGQPPPPPPPPPPTAWYAGGRWNGSNFGVLGRNNVWDPYVAGGHMVESFFSLYDINNGMEVGWVKYPSGEQIFFADVMINGVYDNMDLEAATPGYDHLYRVKNQFASGLPTKVWLAYIDSDLKRAVTLLYEWGTYVLAESESKVSNQNQFGGHFWNLQWGGAFGSYFVWYDWSGTIFFWIDPYYVVWPPPSETELYTGGPT